MVGKNKSAYFQSLIDRTSARMSNWKTKFLSTVGKEILLKAVFQIIPTYTMDIFLLPNNIISRLNNLLKKFWWGYHEECNKIH